MEGSLNFFTAEEGIANLKEAIRIRDMMGGPLYWSISNGEAIKILNKLKNEFADKINIEELVSLFGGQGIESPTRQVIQRKT